ncbi:RNA exonuclease NGL2 [Cryptococcus neoformans Bt85]|nr:RNA exonuclease NGL2 [Cryptococcus neoformans var. grubii Bt85]OXM76233.1 RNA exonuclease NGL2 [Cryptococcus neoformans var. grubii Bt63]
MPREPYVPTPEQIALAERRRAERAAKKAAVAAGKVEPTEEEKLVMEKCKFLKRDWVDVPGKDEEEQGGSQRKRAKIITWNLLAQTLVRRELFPGSDCLRFADRKPMLLAEFAHHSSSDIICLQECDKLPDFLPALPQHTYIKGTGPGKLHGLVVLYRKDRFSLRQSKLIHLDFEEIHPRSSDLVVREDGTESLEEVRRRRGGSRQTKNVGLIVALEGKDGEGVIIVTTHLFWHPKFVYERVRQALLLVRAIRRFQKVNNCTTWPVVLAGDLNTQPSEATYQLLVSPHSPLPRQYLDEISQSRLVHNSLSKIPLIPPEIPSSDSEPASTTGTGTTTPAVTNKTEAEKDGENEDLDDKSTANTRPPRPSDGLPTALELVDLFKAEFPLIGRDSDQHDGAMSAYGSTQWKEGKGIDGFDDRKGFGDGEKGKGGDEPGWTCFTPLFRLTLDYLLVLPPIFSSPSSITPPTSSTSPTSGVEIRKVMLPPKASDLGEGLPRKGICASDHVAVGCEIEW